MRAIYVASIFIEAPLKISKAIVSEFPFLSFGCEDQKQTLFMCIESTCGTVISAVNQNNNKNKSPYAKDHNDPHVTVLKK